MLKNELYLTNRDFESFKPILQGNICNLSDDRKIICYIDSTWVKDYLVKVETVEGPYWHWTSPDMRNDTGYFEVKTTVIDLIKNIRH